MTGCKIFSYTNNKYLELAVHWASRVEKLNLDYEIHCCDKESYQYLHNKNIKCVLSKYQHSFENFNFIDFGATRFKILRDLLYEYDNVIYSDLDTVWMTSPLDKLHEDYDANFSVVTHSNAYPPCVRKHWGITICTGWLHFRNTSIELITDFIENYYAFDGNDQSKFNQFLMGLNDKIDKRTSDGSFTLTLQNYNLTILGLDDNIIYRGNDIVRDCCVVHPLNKNIVEKLA